MTIAAEFAEWALNLTLDDIPVEVQRDACLHLLDGVGCAIAAVRTEAVPYAIKVGLDLGGPERATIIEHGLKISAPAAALTNGILIHALDYDDTHSRALVHATAAVLPATIAVGEETDATGPEALIAAVAAYELVTRLGMVVPHGFHERGFHATSVCGVFAAALASSMLMGLSVEETVSAMGIAGSTAAGSLEFLRTGSSTKQLHPGLASMNGVLAARLAAAGADGPDSIFEGEYGLFRSYLGTDADAGITKTLGAEWEVSQIGVKLFPACQLSLRSLEVLRDVLRRIPGDASISSVVFDMPAGSIPIVCEPAETKMRPRSTYEAKFSLPFCAAAMICDGRLGLDSFGPAALSRTDVFSLASQVSYREVPFDGAPADAPAAVLVTLADGQTFDMHQPQDALIEGSRPRLPVDEPALFEKFHDNGGSDDLKQRIMSLHHVADVRGLLA